MGQPKINPATGYVHDDSQLDACDPPQSTPESRQQQIDHDRETNNVNDEGLTPTEQVEAEKASE
jgi:hypothetical protein